MVRNSAQLNQEITPGEIHSMAGWLGTF